MAVLLPSTNRKFRIVEMEVQNDNVFGWLCLEMFSKRLTN
jgi:hypothetical protein